MNDLDVMPDDDLRALSETAQQIIARRAATANIPAQIAALANEYRENGGDQAALVEAITEQDPE